MPLRRITLVNACQHKSTVLDVANGITAIVGGNGAGKSNLLGLVKANILNDYKHLRGTKRDNIKRKISQEEQAFIETEWVSAHGIVTIRRGLAKCKSALLIDGDDKINGRVLTKESEITDAALNLLGLNKSMVEDFLFADFNDLASVADGNKASRAKLFSNLCGLTKVVAAEKALAAEYSQTGARVEEYSDDEMLQVKSDWIHIRNARRRAKLNIKKLQKKIEECGDLSSLEAAKRKAEAAVSEREELTTEIRKVKDKRRKLVQRMDEARSSLDVKGRVVSGLVDVAEKLETVVGQFDKKKLSTLLRGKIDLPHELVDSTIGNAPMSLPVAIRNFDSLQKKKLYRVKQANTECRTCGTLLKLGDDEREYLSREIAEDKNRFEAMIECVKQTVTEQLRSKKAKQKQLHKVQTRLEETEQEIRDLQTRLEQWELQLSEFDAELDQMQAALSEIPKNLKKISNKQAKQLERSHELHTKLQAEKLKLSANTNIIGPAIKRVRAAIAKRSRNKKMIAWQGLVKLGRSICHRDRLQTTVIQAVSKPLVKSINGLLNELDIPFRASLDIETFSFIIDHGGGETESAERLSHGQKLTLGVAFWLSMAKVFQQELPIFFFDEPSANLDSEHEIDFATFISKLSTQMEQQGRQGIIITHSPVVAECASQLYKLKT